MGQLAGEACAAKAEAVSRFTKQAARAWILAHLSQHGPTSGEDMVDGMEAAGVKPHDGRAFGPIFQGLAQEDLIESYGTAPRRKGHGTNGAVIWRLTSKGRAAAHAGTT